MKTKWKGAFLVVATSAWVVVPCVLLPGSSTAGPAPAASVSVKGKVINTQDLLNPVWIEAKETKSNRYYFMESASTVPKDVRALHGHLSKELCIAILGDSDQTEKHQRTVRLEGGRTFPVTYVVNLGDEITFENKDSFDHELFETSGSGGFAEGAIKPDAKRSWTPPKAGKYELQDKLVPSLRSWIVVEPKLLRAFYPTRKGEFQIDMAPGTYTMRAYFNGEPVGDPLTQTIKDGKEFTMDPLKAGGDPKGGDKKPDDKKPDDKKGG